jgi:hypothetical protein
MNAIRQQQEEKKRQMARVTFSSRRHQGKYSVYLDKKKIGYYHLISLTDNTTHTGAYTKSMVDTHYWAFVDERTDTAYRRDNLRVNYSGDNNQKYIQHKIARFVPFPLPVYTEEEKREMAEFAEVGQKIINGMMGVCDD